MSVENGTAFYFCILIVSEYQQTDLFVKIEQIENRDVLVRDVNFSHKTLLHASLCMYLFDYYRSALSVSVHTKGSAEDVTTPSTSGMTVDD